MPPHALIVEDDPDVARLIAFNLQQAGLGVEVTGQGLDAVERALARIPDVIILDLALPDLSGLEVARRLRADPRTARVGIIVVSASGDDVDRVAGLELGVDDYLAKPFAIRELVLRVNAVVRRSVQPTPDPLRRGAVELRVAEHEVRVAGELVSLRRLEFRILELLLGNPERVFSREVLLERVWPGDTQGNVRLVDVAVSRLRDNLGPQGDVVETVFGVGYRARREPTP